MAAKILLDVCTPEGKTWLAHVTGLGGKFGVERDFIHAACSDLSRSGRTGTKTYIVDDGIYESNEGRRSIRPQRKWWRVEGDDATQITEDEAHAALKALSGGAQ